MSKSNIPRFYVPGLISGEIALPDNEARHAAGSLRLSKGDTITVFDGCGNFAKSTIVSLKKREVLVNVSEIQTAARPKPAVNLAFAIPKAKRLDWLLEKATELGVATLSPIVFDRSVAGGDKLTTSKRDRWLTHCIAACKQCRLNFLPELAPIRKLDNFLANPPQGLLLLGDLEPTAESIGKIISQTQAENITIIVGPEGGIAPEEREKILSSGFTPAKLGQTTLRIETAAIALLAAISATSEL